MTPKAKSHLRRKKSPRRVLEDELDSLWGLAVRRAGRHKCARCGRYFNPQSANYKQVLHPHHIFSRRHKSIKWNVRNGIPLCYRDHFFWARSSELSDKEEYVRVINDYTGESTLVELRKLKETGSQARNLSILDLDAVKVELETILA